MAGGDRHAPHLIDLEVTSAVRRLTAAGDLEAPAADDAVRRLAAAPVERHPHTPLLGRAWELRASVTSCDASRAALAEALDRRLLTCDGRLARAPARGARWSWSPEPAAGRGWPGSAGGGRLVR